METFDSMDQVQHWVLASLLSSGTPVSPRGHMTRELEAVQFRLRNPRARYIANAARRWSLPIAVGEFAWHAGGNRTLEHLTYYLPRWAELSDDEAAVRGSCYGWRIFRPTRGAGRQWDRLIGLPRPGPD